MSARRSRLLSIALGALFAVAALAVAAATLPAPVHAQGGDQTRARELFDRAIAASADGRFDEAALLFERSFELVPRANTQYNRAIALDRIARPREALEALRIYFELAPADDPGFADATALRDRLRERLVRLELTVDPPDATVEVDGVAERGEGGSRVLLLDPAEHRIRVSARGREPREITVRALPGDTIQESVALATDPSAATPEAPATDAGAEPFGALGVTGSVLAGVGVLTGVASLVTGLMADDIESGLVARCGDRRRECPPGSEADIEEGRSLAWASTGLTIAAGVALAAGATLIVVDLVDGSGADARATLQLRSVAGGGVVQTRVRW